MAGDVALLERARQARPRLEAALERARKDLGISALLGLILSLVGYAVLGGVGWVVFLFVCYDQGYREPPLPLWGFWLAYTGLVALLVLASKFYTPKEDYYLGRQGWGGGLRDDPFTFRDDADRAHLSLGFALALFNFIRLNFVSLFQFLSARQAIANPAAAAAVVLLAREEAGGERLRSALGPFPPGEVKEAVAYFARLKWVKLSQRDGQGCLFLTSLGARALEGVA